MIRGARATLEQAPLLLVWPCAALTLTILAMNLLCDALRDAVDPRTPAARPKLRLIDRVLPGLAPPPRIGEATFAVRDLTVEVDTPAGPIRPVEEVSLSVNGGRTLAIVGESGSGKSLTALALLGLLPSVARPVAGSAWFGDTDLLRLRESELRKLRGGAIATIFQDPMSSLNPVHRVGDQVIEAILAHRPVSRAAARAEALSLFRRVGIADPEQRLASYPHEMSGGMKQRVMIAMALANRPALLIADEPTTALDVTVQAQILELLLELQRETGTALIFITHSLSVVAEIADRVNVMYAGQVVEEGLVDEVFREPLHPYTRALLAASPDSSVRQHPRHGAAAACVSRRLPLRAPVPACRAGLSGGACPAAAAATGPAHALHPLERADAGAGGRRMSTAETMQPLVEARAVSKSFATGGMFRRGRMVQAVRAVDADVARGETVGVVGESGSGKSTLGRLMLGLTPASEGFVRFDGRRLDALSRAEMRRARRRMQIVFQDPFGSLDPRRRVGAQIEDGLAIHAVVAPAQRAARVSALLEKVGLDATHARRFPHEFSGGQRQRIGIARALATAPDFLVADEPVSSLDVSIQAQIVQLMADLRSELGLAMLFISHDLSIVRHLCHRVIVMYLGRVMEEGDAQTVLSAPAHPYTRALISATPRLHRAQRTRRILLPGDPPSPSNPPSGCVFRTRCAHAIEACAVTVPTLQAFGASRRVACIRADEIG